MWVQIILSLLMKGLAIEKICKNEENFVLYLITIKGTYDNLT